MQVSGIRCTDIDTIWPEVKPLLRRAIEKSCGAYSAETVLEALKTREAQLWVSHRDRKIVAAMVTELKNAPDERFVHIALLGGRELAACWATFSWFCSWAAAHGARSLRSETVKGMTRLLKKHGFQVVGQGPVGDYCFKDITNATVH